MYRTRRVLRINNIDHKLTWMEQERTFSCEVLAHSQYAAHNPVSRWSLRNQSQRVNSKFTQLYFLDAFLKHKIKSFISDKLCCFAHLSKMTIVHIEVITIRDRVHVQMANNLRAACHLQQELGAWFFAVSLPFLFHSSSHLFSFIPVHIDLQGIL